MNDNFVKNEARWSAFDALLRQHKSLAKKHLDLIDEYSSLTKKHLDLIEKLETFRDNLPTNPTKTQEDKIIEQVIEEFEADPRTQTRKAEVVVARQAATFLIKQTTNLSLKKIAEATGLIDHVSALHNYHKAIQKMAEDEDFCWRVKNVANELGIKNISVPLPKTSFNITDKV